ncbi:glucosaminidase domain-containing protein [Acuticoccus kandeliae]|uniref:glucosaminidase domain-containing protein n=1 Tax=Acuticoccus kandeliae TaxID=2073160 RepID=UPI00147606C0|nr:glucosaminidase domain-containing protein [Acuticoccus kandeliae]
MLARSQLAFDRERAVQEELEDQLDALSPQLRVEPPPPPSDALAAEGLAVVIGHTALAQGNGGASPPMPRDDPATGLNEEHEYAWNTDLANRIKARADRAGFRCAIFRRDGLGIAATYQQVAAWGPEAAIELHFNGGPSARGSLVLYGAERSKAWARLLQDMQVRVFNRQGRFEDRGIIIPGPNSGYPRGVSNVTQFHPSALIEPFFGDNPADAALGIRHKDDLADGIIASFAAFTGRQPATGTVEPPVVGGGEPVVQGTTSPDIPDEPLFRQLLDVYRSMTLKVEGLSDAAAASLKAITLSQWIEESGWGSSELARQHFNFAGMKAIAEVDRIIREVPAAKVQYNAHDGPSMYLRFNSVADFIVGYFMFLDRSPYAGWRDQAAISPHEFIRFIGRKWATKPGYASRVIAIEGRLIAAGLARADGTLVAAGDVQPPAVEPEAEATDGKRPDPAAVAAAGATATFIDLVGAVLDDKTDLAAVRLPLAAQWALESNWGRSDLALIHFNFAGIAWSDLFEGRAARVPHPVDPSRGDFCRFLSPAAFVDGVIARLDNDPAFAGWRDHAQSVNAFAEFLARTWRPGDPKYAEKIIGICERIGRAPSRPADPVTDSRPGPATDGPSEPVIPVGQGVVLRIKRIRSERRAGMSHDRTVGEYQLFVDGNPVGGLTGMTFERQGPGDNSSDGVRFHRRIREGRYPLFTHAGSATIGGVTKFKTIGFSSNDGVRHPPMPSIRVGETRSRAGILLHPGQNYVWSIGCINPSTPLSGANGAMDYRDSRTRVIAIIDAMRNALGGRFPTGNNAGIPGAILEIVGEPGPASGPAGAAGPLDSLGEAAPTEAAFAQADLAMAEEILTPSDAAGLPPIGVIHGAIEAVLVASSILGRPPGGLLDNVLRPGPDLAQIRGDFGETLWSAWSLAWSIAIGQDLETRQPILARLTEIARVLVESAVPIDDTVGVNTPMVEAALGNDVAALEALVQFGADVNAFSRSGLTPLLAAAAVGSAAACAWLLLNGADPHLRVRDVVEDLGEAAGELLGPPGADAMRLAELGIAAVGADPIRFDDFERVRALIWERLNP